MQSHSKMHLPEAFTLTINLILFREACTQHSSVAIVCFGQTTIIKIEIRDNFKRSPRRVFIIINLILYKKKFNNSKLNLNLFLKTCLKS